ncbi:MAG: iron uptake transporter permease EfeU [Jatrophihabitantaceae bacterium]
MLPTFVIGLREGLEAALIVGIIAAFLRKQGRRDLLRWVFVGVTVAVLLCLGVGITLDELSHNLPQRQQEGLETAIGVLAVAMVTYMVIWMRRHSRELKGQLEGMAAEAMDGTSRAARAMILMAFLAVLREGFETVVFLLAAFNESGSGSAAALGAVLGLLVAIALGYGIYRGGVRLNLSKFFRATGLVLVLVAAGLVVNALHTAHEAGWLNAGQGGTVDLSWLVRPGSVQASLLTGMLGVQPRPVLIEVIGWLVYLIPVGLYVAWPPGRAVPRRALSRVLLAIGSVAVVAALACALLAPGTPPTRPVTQAGGVSVQLISRSGDTGTVRTQVQSPAGGGVGALTDIDVERTGAQARAGVGTEVYTATVTGTSASTLPASLDSARIAQLNGGRLPIGLQLGSSGSAPAAYTDHTALTVWVEPRTDRVIDLRWTERVTVTVSGPGGATFALGGPAAQGTGALPSNAVAAAAATARPQLDDLNRRSSLLAGAWLAGVAAFLLLLGAVAAGRSTVREDRRRRDITPVEALVKS